MTKTLEPRTRRALAASLALGVAFAAAAGCSEKTSGDSAAGGKSTTTVTASDCTADSVVECAPEGTTFPDLLPPKPIVADGTPIKVGMINTDTGPTNAFPELTGAARAGVEWINTELGGVDGHPLELFPCDVEMTATGSRACGQQMVEDGVVAALGGIDIFDDSVQVLQDNQIPLVGGIPVGFATVNSPIAFAFSGGAWSGDISLAYHITEVLHAERVSILYSDYGPITDAASWAQRALVRGGVAENDVNMVPMPIVAEDILTPMTAANESNPDAVIVLVTGAGCSAAFQAAQDIGVKAQLYFSGGCLDPNITADGLDKIEGYIFNVENVVEGSPPDVELYTSVMNKYAKNVEPASAATVSFKSLMNLYDQMVSIGADELTSASLMTSLRASVDHPSFMGPPYTCDGKQMGGKLPAVCAPQEILTQMTDGALRQITDWIDIAAYVGAGV